MRYRRRAALALLGLLAALLLPTLPAQAGTTGARSSAGVPDVVPVVRILHREHPPHVLPLDAVAPAGDVPATRANDKHPPKVAPGRPQRATGPLRSRGPPKG